VDDSAFSVMGFLTLFWQLTVIQKNFSKYPRVDAWLNDMRALPEFAVAHDILQAGRASFLFLMPLSDSFLCCT
jgi:glutathione S-transferase